MAEWSYDSEDEAVYDWDGECRAVAEAVGPQDGPLIAEAPAMEALLRELAAVAVKPLGNPYCQCLACRTVALIRRIDEARKGDA